MRLDIAAQPGRLPGATLGEGHITLLTGHLGEPREHFMRKKPNQTLSPLPCWPTRFMPSFQSPEPIERQAVLTKSEAPKDGSHTVVI